MGLTAPNQPPRIVHPSDAASDVPIDVFVFGVGDTIAGAPPPIQFEHASGSIHGVYERLGGYYSPSPHGPEFRPFSCIRPERALPPQTSISLTYDGRVLVRFTTGTESTRPSAPPRPCAPPPGPMPRPGLSGPGATFAVELGEGPYVIDDGSITWVVSGPGISTIAVASGSTVRIRDARLVVVFETIVGSTSI